jgi:hypothetical protein
MDNYLRLIGPGLVYGWLHETVIDAKWLGACPANMKLGDVAGPDGKVMMNALNP